MGMVKERQVIVTWTTPGERLPDPDMYVVVTVNAQAGGSSWENALMTGAYYDDTDEWEIVGLPEEADYEVVAWADLDPYGM